LQGHPFPQLRYLCCVLSSMPSCQRILTLDFTPTTGFRASSANGHRQVTIFPCLSCCSFSNKYKTFRPPGRP
jgi:hypothetical protein